MRLTGKYTLDLVCPMRSRSSDQNISVRYNTVPATWVYLCLEQGFLQPGELATVLKMQTLLIIAVSV